MKLTPEDQSKLRDRELANIIRKLHGGKTLTAREQAKLDAATAAPGVDPTGYVGTWDELAARLGVTRRAIQDWRNDPRHAPEIARRKNLLERADGRHCVAAWLGLMEDLRLNRGKAPAEAQDDQEGSDEEGQGLIQPPRYGGKESDWQKAKVAKDVEKKGIEIESIKGTLLEAQELEVALGATFAAVQTKLAQFPARVARYLRGLTDIGEIEDKLRDELDADLGDLNAARYMAENAVAEAVAALPFDAETEQMVAAVCFDGQDREALLQLITAVATQALRSVGRRAILRALHEQEIPDTAIADEVTGQVTDEAATRESHGRVCASESASSCAGAGEPPAPPEKASDSKRASKTKASADTSGDGPRSKKARPKTTQGPAASEAMIAAGRQRKKTSRRRR